MKETQAFYYKFKKNWFWMGMNILLLALMLCCCIKYPSCLYWRQTKVLIGTLVFSFVAWGLKYWCRHRVALLDENGIKIDHCSPLPWKNIKNAEYKTAKCCFQKLPVIILNPKKNIKYHYNFMQKRCAKMDFTAFSIPLYAMTPEDGEKIAALIGKKVKFINKKTALS